MQSDSSSSAEDKTGLPSVGAFKELPDDVREKLAGYGKVETHMHGEYLATQGEPHASMSMVLKGKLGVSCNAHGDHVDLATLRAGDLVGEISLIDSHHSSADVIVTSESARLWTLAHDAFERFLEEDPKSGVHVLRAIAGELCHRLRLNSEKMLREVETRKARFLDMDF